MDKPTTTSDGQHMISDGLLWARWDSDKDPWVAKFDNPTLRICGWKSAYWYLPESAA